MRRAVASTLVSLLAIAAVFMILDANNSEVLREGPVVGPDALDGQQQILLQLASTRWRAREDDPSAVEARALKAVSHTTQAGKALQSSREAVVRLQQLGDIAGASAAIQAEHHAKRAFIAARAVSAPLVAEARANYEAAQGSEIQQVAKQVAQDTWRTMTGRPLSTRDATNAAQDSVASIGSREAAVTRATMQVANSYAQQAHDAQWRAIQAQRSVDNQGARGANGGAAYGGQAPPGGQLPPPGYAAPPQAPAAVAYGQGLGTIDSGNDVTAVARYAKQAQDAMKATQDAQALMKQQLDEMRKERKEMAAKAAAKNATNVPGDKPTSAQAEAESVISNAEQDVASSMRTVEEAAQQRGLADNSWKNRIGDMLKSGQSAEADEAAQAYVQNHVDSAAATAVGGSSIDDAAKQVEDAQRTIDAKAGSQTEAGGEAALS